MSTMYTIAFPTSTFLPGLGGVEIGLHNIVSRLKKMGYRPIVIIPISNYLKLRKEKQKFPYEIIPFPPKIWWIIQNYPSVGLKITGLFFFILQKIYKFDFWHCTVGYPIGVAMIKCSKLLGTKPYLIRCAGEDIQIMPEINYGMRLNKKIDDEVKANFPDANLLVGITQSVIDEYLQLGVSMERIKHVPNGVEVDRFKKIINRKTVLEKYGIGNDEFVFLTVGRNHIKKNFKLIIDALKILKSNTPIKCKVLFVGNSVKELHHYASDCSVIDFVIFSEPEFNIDYDKFQLPADELIDTYLSADAFICPSYIETFGIVIVEAMAAGLPVITTNAAGCRDLVRNGDDGIMVDKKDPAELATAMIKLINDQELRNEYKMKSKKRAEDFDWDHVVDMYSSIYREEINKYVDNQVS